MNTRIMPVTDLRRQTSAVIRSIQENGTVVTITQNGRPTAVLIDYEQYQALLLQAQHQGWPSGYFGQTYGALAGDPLTRPEQEDFDIREPVQ
ncbi:MAG TPA: type II toxin-antitoxin system Phd/YefM family antitoxin [Caldilineaceae bacterium]|nr:type II toxin-antitoxin system Phd/YefM family antitoxin [Caldilineaceae bacterium]